MEARSLSNSLRLRVSVVYKDMVNEPSRLHPSRILLAVILTLFLIPACSPGLTATPFIPPTAEAPLIEPGLIIQPTRQVEVAPSTPLPTIAPTIDPDQCVNSLTFIDDLTVPDNSSVPYGSTIDKQWRVQNSGTCNWNSAYRLRHTDGAALGAPEEIALYPARAGTQATIQIIFAAPFTDGEYESTWQAFDPNGLAFGEPIFIRILVAAP